MKQISVATLQAPPLTRKRISSIPRRINGLYRLSITSKEKFQVDIGGRWLQGVRTLDVFHESPMFMDSFVNVHALDIFVSGKTTRAVQIFPGEKPAESEFRITAHDVMPERAELESRKKLASLETPLVYEGFVKHSVHFFEGITSGEDAEDFAQGDTLERAATILLIAGAGALLACGLFAAAALVSPAVAVAVAPAVTVAHCPSRTYINGKLFKNLKEVRVKLPSGRIMGYTSP